jgi:predicted DNA-binding antitoxin AbrB/MazE fold protein
MTLTVEAIYENGVLKPTQPLPLQEHEKVQITIHTAVSRVRATAGLIPCQDAKLIERIAEDEEFSLLEAP